MYGLWANYYPDDPEDCSVIVCVSKEKELLELKKEQILEEIKENNSRVKDFNNFKESFWLERGLAGCNIVQKAKSMYWKEYNEACTKFLTDRDLLDGNYHYPNSIPVFTIEEIEEI